MAEKIMETYPSNIESMIAEENDPKTRMHLIILNNMNRTQVSMLESIQNLNSERIEPRKSFVAHEEDQQNIVNQGRGMWRILGWMLAIVQAIGASTLYVGWNTLREMQSTDMRLEQKLSDMVKK
jgi:hypothetical protein